jgi:hypothetical protein
VDLAPVTARKHCMTRRLTLATLLTLLLALPAVTRGDGLPVSVDGRWAYTLYSSSGSPFVHALDTATRTARCIDVPPFQSAVDPFAAKLRLLPGDRLLVIAGGRTLATIDTRKLAVVVPPRRSATRSDKAAAGSSGLLVALVVTALALALLGAAYGARRSISHRPPPARA